MLSFLCCCVVCKERYLFKLLTVCFSSVFVCGHCWLVVLFLLFYRLRSCATCQSVNLCVFELCCVFPLLESHFPFGTCSFMSIMWGSSGWSGYLRSMFLVAFGGVGKLLSSASHHWVSVCKYLPPDPLKTRVEDSHITIGKAHTVHGVG